MRLQVSPYVLPLLISAGTSAALGYFAWRRRQLKTGARPFAGMMLAGAFWALMDALSWASADTALKEFWLRLRYLGIVSIPVMWLLFSAEYTQQDRWLTRPRRLGLGILPAVFLLLVWTNQATSLVWPEGRQNGAGALVGSGTTWGPAFWVHTSYAYLLLAGGVVLIVRALVISPQKYRGRVGGLLIGILAPWIGNALFLAGLLPFPDLDPTPFMFAVSGLAFGLTILPNRIFDVIPYAHGEVIRGLTDGVLVLDPEGRVVDLNPAALTLIGTGRGQVMGRPATEALSDWPEAVEQVRRGLDDEAEMQVRRDGIVRPYSLRISTLFNPQGDPSGRLVHLRDISQQVQTEADLARTQKNFLSVVEDLEDAYFEADLMGRLTYVNKAFCTATGYERDYLVGQPYRRIVAREAVRLIFGVFAAVLKTRLPVEKQDLEYVTREGIRRNAELSVSVIESERGEVLGTRGIIRDVTERIGAEQAIRQAKETAEARAEELATLNRLGAILSSSLQLQEVLESISRELARIFDAPDAGVVVLNRDQTAMRLVAFQAEDPQKQQFTNTQFPLPQTRETEQLLRLKAPMVVRDADTSPLTAAIRLLLRSRGTKDLLIAPLLARGQIIGMLGISIREPGRVFADSELSLAETIASQVANAMENAQLYAETEAARDMAEHDLEIGRQIQSSFFPIGLPRVQGWEIAADFQAARQVAGDFYDVFPLGEQDKIGVVVADVCDKGVGAALFMALFRSLIRAFADQQFSRPSTESPGWQGTEASLANVVSQANDYIANTHGHSNMFATMFFAVLDPSTGVMHYVNGGHDAPVIISREGVAARLTPTGPAVGMLPGLRFHTGLYTLTPGDFLLAFTDGVVDARTRGGSPFTEERLLFLVEEPPPSASTLVERLVGALQSYIRGEEQFDDMTLLAVRRSVSHGSQSQEIMLDAEMQNLPSFREFVEQSCQAAKLEDEVAFALKLAADEACANVIQHAYVQMPAGKLKLIFEGQPDKVRLTLLDWGRSFQLKEVPTPDLWADWQERPVGGLGLHLMRELVDELIYEPNPHEGNRLTLGKFLPAKVRV